MQAQNGGPHPRKRRRRRRRLDRPAISARLLLDDRIQGEAGVLSQDLFADLFPGYNGIGKGSMTHDCAVLMSAASERQRQPDPRADFPRRDNPVAAGLPGRAPKCAMDYNSCSNL